MDYSSPITTDGMTGDLVSLLAPWMGYGVLVAVLVLVGFAVIGRGAAYMMRAGMAGLTINAVGGSPGTGGGGSGGGGNGGSGNPLDGTGAGGSSGGHSGSSGNDGNGSMGSGPSNESGGTGSLGGKGK